MDFLRSWVGMLRGVGLRNVLIVGLEYVLFECASYNSQRQNFLDYMKQILTLEALETFLHNSIFDKAVFCLGKNKVC